MKIPFIFLFFLLAIQDQPISTKKYKLTGKLQDCITKRAILNDHCCTKQCNESEPIIWYTKNGEVSEIIHGGNFGLDGSFTINDLEAGTKINLHFRHPEYEDSPKEHTISRDEDENNIGVVCLERRYTCWRFALGKAYEGLKVIINYADRLEEKFQEDTLDAKGSVTFKIPRSFLGKTAEVEIPYYSNCRFNAVIGQTFRSMPCK